MNKSQKTESKILLIDDHPITIDFYKNLLQHKYLNKSLSLLSALNCEEAYQVIATLHNSEIPLDVAIIDINLPPFLDFKSGADIAVLIKKHFPKCKLLIVTAFSEPIIIYNLLQKISIEALLCKSDIGFEELSAIYENVINGKYFISKTIKEKFATIGQHKFDLDHYDLEILQRLDEGKKTSNLIKYIDLSLSAIEKRKANMKRLLLKDGGNDAELLEKAKEKGIL